MLHFWPQEHNETTSYRLAEAGARTDDTRGAAVETILCSREFSWEVGKQMTKLAALDDE